MTTNVFHYWQLILCWRLSFYFSKIYWWLFPFDYRESQTAQLRPASEPGDRQYSDFDRTDTRSSLASYGRMAVDFRRELSVPPTEESSRQSSPNLHEVEEKEIFHPSSDDNFFKISNPVSERLADFESEINGCAQDTVNFHKPSDNRRQTCWNGVGSNDFNAGDQPEEDHIYETVNVRKTASESLDKSPSPSNILSSWWVLNVRCVKLYTYCILDDELTPLASTRKSLLTQKRHVILNLKTDRNDFKTCPNCFSVEKQLGEFILVYSNCLFEESNCAI